MEPRTRDERPGAGTTVPLRAERARRMLRKLRDLNLRASRIAVGAGRTVCFAGCLSADLPAEESLVYRVQVDDEPEGELAVRWREGWLELSLTAVGADLPQRNLATPLHEDEDGRAHAPELNARLDPDSTDPREIEHFLRRLIRGVLAPG